jgi:hypothetical protein
MKLVPVVTVLLAAFASLSGHPQQPSPSAANFGAWMSTLPGDLNSCGSWLQARKGVSETTDVSAFTRESAGRAWIWGFVSGASAYGRRALDDPGPGALDAWVDRYCAEHRLDELHGAALQLVEELAARKGRPR